MARRRAVNVRRHIEPDRRKRLMDNRTKSRSRICVLLLLALLGAAAMPLAGAGRTSGKRIVGMAITQDTGHTFAWYGDRTVSSGTSDDLSRHRRPKPYVMPGGYSPDDIVGIVCRPFFFKISGAATLRRTKAVPATFVYYRDGKYSVGISVNLAKYQGPKPYKLPRGYRPTDIVGMSYSKKKEMKMTPNRHQTYPSWAYQRPDGTRGRMGFFVWFRDGRVSAGYDAHQLDNWRKPYQYVLPSGKRSREIVGMGCAPDTGHHYAWYADGDVSSGVSDQLDRHRSLYRYRMP
jgi:hypothetical protein